MKRIYHKKITLTAICLGLLITISSCEGFLDETPYSFTSSDDLYTSKDGAELALTGVYDVLNAGTIQGKSNHNMWGRGMHYLMMLGDEILPKNNISDVKASEITYCAYSTESDYVTMAWFGLFVGIDRANHIIQKVPSIEMDETRRNEIVAEAHFFRGFYRLYLAWLFGEVPLPNEPNADPAEPRQPLEDVYSMIESDLAHAYDVLPDRNSKSGRINKWTAAGFLVKMYTYLAACKENNVGKELNSTINNIDWVDSNDMYAKAHDLAKDIYENSGYRMIVPYHYAFLEVTKSQQKEECLMLVQTGVGGASEYLLTSYLAIPGGGSSNGGGYGWMRPSGEISKRYHQNDPRFKWNIASSLSSTSFEMINNVKYFTPVPLYSSGSNLCFGKFRQADPAVRTAQGIPTWAGVIDFPILRFADIVLLYAEAKYKTGDEAGARGLLSEVRERACTNLSGVLDQATLNQLNTTYFKEDFMEELMDERSRELCTESWRRIDLIRMGRMTSVIESMQTTTVDRYYYWNGVIMQLLKDNYEPYKIWFPIPKREIAVNPNLKQNPGYPEQL